MRHCVSKLWKWQYWQEGGTLIKRHCYTKCPYCAPKQYNAANASWCLFMSPNCLISKLFNNYAKVKGVYVQKAEILYASLCILCICIIWYASLKNDKNICHAHAIMKCLFDRNIQTKQPDNFTKVIDIQKVEGRMSCDTMISMPKRGLIIN